MYLHRSMMVSRALMRLALLATLVVLALSACGGGGGGEEQANKPRPLPEVEEPLRPGIYRTEEFKPSFSFRVGEDWSMETDPPEGPDELELTWRRGTMNLFILNAKEVYEPIRTGTPSVVDAPKDMVGWFRLHPYLRAEKPEPVMVGGVEGVRLDMVVEDPPKEYYGNCASQYNVTDCVDIVPISMPMVHPLAFEEGIKERVIVLEEVKGEPLIIDFGASEAKFDEFAPEGQKLVDSMKWTNS